MKFNKTLLLILTAFLISSVTLSFFYFRAYQNMNNSIKESEKEQVILQFMHHLDNIKTNFVDIESAESPSLIINHNELQQSFERAIISNQRELALLKNLNRFNFVPPNEIFVLDSLIAERQNYSKEIIRLSLNGRLNDAQALANTGKGILLHTLIKKQDAILENEGRVLLNGFKLKHTEDARKSQELFGVCGLIALLLMVYTLFKILQDNSLKSRLAKQNEFLAEVVNKTSDAVVTFNQFHIITSWNKAAEKMYGIKAEDIIGSKKEFVFGRDNSVDIKHIIEHLKKEGHWSGEFKDSRANGSTIDVFVSITVLKNEAEEIIKYISINIDITEQKKATQKIAELAAKLITLNSTLQEKVDEQTAKLTALIEHTPAYLCEINREGIILNLNRSYIDSLKKDKLIGTYLHTWIADREQASKIKTIIDHVFTSNQSYFYDHSMLNSNNKLHYYSSSYIPVVINGKTESVIYTAYDITKQKETEDELKKLVSILDHSEILVGIMDMDFKIDYLNKAAKKRIGINEQENIRTLDAVDYFSANKQFNEQIMSELFSTGKWVGENKLLSRINEKIPIMQVLMVHKNENGKPLYVSATGIDISELKQKEKELNKLAGIIENTKALVLIVDVNFRIQYLNASAKERLGIGNEEDITLLSGLDFIPDEVKEKMDQEKEKLFSTGKWVGEKKIKSKNGEIFPVLEVAMIHKDDLGVPQYFSFTFLDILDLKQKESELENLSSIIENSPAYISMADLDKNLIYANRAFRDAFEIEDKEDITAINIANFRSISTIEVIQNGNEANLKNGKWTGVNTFVSRRGKVIHVLEVLVVHKDDSGKPHHISFTAIDITEQRKAEQELKKMNADLRQLSMHLQTVREEERKEIAREIHDEFGQKLTALKMSAAWLKKHLLTETDPGRVQEKLGEVMEIADETINTSRKLYSSLHPSMLDDIGVIAAIEWHIKSYTKSSGIAVDLITNIPDERLSQNLSIGLFRICQESLTNVLRHANATRVNVEITKTKDKLLVSIEDNGNGFDVSKVNTRTSHGLLGMRERVYAINGTLQIESSSNKGTKISVTVPIV